MSPLDMMKGVDFDLLAHNILCNADRDGAKVYEVEVTDPYTSCTYRVLAHSDECAEEAAREAFIQEYIDECIESYVKSEILSS